MGYYSDFYVRLIGEQIDVDFFVSDNPIVPQYGDRFNEHFWLNREEENWVKRYTKWYDYNEDMLFLSRKYPNIEFEMIRYGENAGDIEKYIYSNGNKRGGKAVIDWPKD